MRSLALTAALLAAFSSLVQAEEAALPEGYVFLEKLAPSIIQDMRYATARNFTGAPLPGYTAPRCVLRLPVAEALAKVQEALQKDGLSLKVYDCYRPQRAVLAMHAWVGAGGGDGKPSRYMPNVKRRNVIKDGYVAKRSSHANGTAVDLTIVAAAKSGEPEPAPDRSCTEGPDDHSVDMGTAFDCFDPKSATQSREITPEQRQWRQRLLHEMRLQGFENYRHEWWHFTYPGIARRGESDDFPIEADVQ